MRIVFIEQNGTKFVFVSFFKYFLLRVKLITCFNLFRVLSYSVIINIFYFFFFFFFFVFCFSICNKKNVITIKCYWFVVKFYNYYIVYFIVYFS